ncbi:MAG: NAD(P)-dependent oxidoreductase [Coriobacteriales bacterium]|jgi:nucleoside-diphosphate-sugar epimerase|nr:NAD(P)-dependent oxidoreductase [Coriobacteriales bacterium]
MRRVLVTGARGFVGGAVTRYLCSKGVEVVALVREDASKGRTDLPMSVITVPFDISSVEGYAQFIPKNDYDVFYHFAWSGSAGSARADVALQLDNAKWAVDCLRLAERLGCKRFVGAGSIVEHETMAAAYTRGNKPGLGYVYGGGKLISHVMCASVAADVGIDLICPVLTNAYGPGEVSPRLVNTTLRKCLQRESPQFTSGTQNYDFVYIDDVARAFYLIAENGRPFNEYLIGSSTARPLKEFLLEMQKAVAPDVEFIFGDIPFTGIDLPLSAFDCSVTERDTGFCAEVSFAEGACRTMQWIKEQETE